MSARSRRRDGEAGVQTETGKTDGCRRTDGRTDGERREQPGGRAGGVRRERGSPGGADWLWEAEGGARGGWAAGAAAARAPAPRRSAPLSGPGVPGHPAPRRAHRGGSTTARLGSVSGEGPGPPGLRPELPPLLSVRPGVPGAPGGGRFWPVPPPHAPPRGPDSGVRGRTGDARPVYPPGAASAPTGGAARAGEGEGSPPGPATSPGRSALGRETPSSRLSDQTSRLSLLPPPARRCLLPGPGRAEPVARESRRPRATSWTPEGFPRPSG